MIHSYYVAFTSLVDLSEVTGEQVESAAGFIAPARILTVVSWCKYPVVDAVKSIDWSCTTTTVYEQIGYSVAGITTTMQRDDILLLLTIIFIINSSSSCCNHNALVIVIACVCVHECMCVCTSVGVSPWAL
jgi:hypothetical protein